MQAVKATVTMSIQSHTAHININAGIIVVVHVVQVRRQSGVIGNIVDMNDDEIVLRVEEGRIRFSRGAIQGVVGGSKGSSLTETKEASKTVNV